MTESRQWLILVSSVLLVWIIYLLAPVITPFALAAGLAYLGDPLVDRLQTVKMWRWRLNRTVAVVVVFLFIFLGLLLTLLIFIPLLFEQVRNLVERVPNIFAWLVDTAIPNVQAAIGIELLHIDAASVKEGVVTYWGEISGALLDVMGTVSAGGKAFIGWLVALLLVPVLTFYLLRDWDKLVEGVRHLLPQDSEPTVSRLAAEIDDVIGAFLRGQLLVMIGLGVIYTIGLWLIGLELAVLIGMLAGLLSVVPYLGTFAGVVAALIAAGFQFQDVLHPALVLLVFGIGQSLESMVLTPYLVGDRVGLHPVVVIFAVLAGGHLFGFLGILLALPVAAALNVLVRYAHQRYRHSSLYRQSPDPDAP